MIKLIITILLPFIGPMIAYSIWQKIIMRKHKKSFKTKIIIICLLTGTLLAALSLFTFGLQKSSYDPASYKPSSVKDGKIVPGTFDY